MLRLTLLVWLSMLTMTESPLSVSNVAPLAGAPALNTAPVLMRAALIQWPSAPSIKTVIDRAVSAAKTILVPIARGIPKVGLDMRKILIRIAIEVVLGKFGF